jgi:hypothetical protein
MAKSAASFIDCAAGVGGIEQRGQTSGECIFQQNRLDHLLDCFECLNGGWQQLLLPKDKSIGH